MRVLIMLPTDETGGAQNVLKTLVRELLEIANVELHLVFLAKGCSGGWQAFADRTTLHFVAARREVTGVIEAARLVRRLSIPEFDLAIASHTHCNGFLGTLRMLGVLRTRRLVARESTVTGERFRGVKRLLLATIYRFCYRSVDMVVCQTPRMRDALVRFVPGMEKQQLRVLPNPIDAAAIRRRAQQGSSSWQGGDFIVAIGRLVHVKGYDLLIRAFVPLQQRYPKLSLVIIGEGPERATLENLIAAQGMSSSIHLIGHLDNPFALASRALAGVVSSRIEGFPNVVLEMLALGLPIVSTRCTDGLEDLANVTLCPAGDVAALSAALDAVCNGADAAARDAVDACLELRNPRRFVLELLRECEISLPAPARVVAAARAVDAGTAMESR